MSTTPSTHSKRHSLNIHPSSGPRPLQLVNGITSPTKPTSATTSTSTSTSTRSHVHDGVSPTYSSQSTPRSPRTPSDANLRRHSSISYKSSNYDHYIATNQENDVPSTQFQRKSRPKSLMFPAHPSHPGHSNTLVTVSSLLARDNSDSRDWNFDPGLNVNGAGGTGASTPTEERERRPLTLVEKHADLLRFIAQKESKCLELRSQLATHEAELVQLKRKWERIVSRSFEPPLSPPGSTSPSPSLSSESTSPLTTNNIPTVTNPTGTVFEGIKESVQGVSRLITSGLSASGDYHHHNYNLASPLSLHSQSRPSTTQPRPRAKPRPHSLYSQYPPITAPSHNRSANLSASSNATSSTSTSSSADSVSTPTTASVGTTFSAASSDSSSSSFEEDEQNATTLHTKTRETCSSPTTRDAKVAEDAELSANCSEDSWSSSELIVRDTGATPMMSPNPKFKFAAGRRQREKTGFSKTNDKKRSVELEIGKNEEEGIVNEPACPGMGNSSAISRSNSNSRCHRRKSRDVSGLVSSSSYDFPASPCLDLNSTPPISGPSQQTRSGSTLSPSPVSLPTPGTKSQRNSLVGTFAPVSTIPGLCLAESAAMHMTGACGSNGETSGPSHPMRMEMENEARRASTHQHQQTQLAQEHPPSSWMGKKWDKWTQKRASGLLSDVSQTLAHAFSLSTTNSTTHPIRHSASSILDQDDDFVSSMMMDEPMKPTTVVVSPRTADIGHQGQGQLDESEWDW